VPPAPPARPAGSGQIDAAEAELRRGNVAATVEIVTPWAWAGVPRAQALLGQALARRAGTQQIPTAAYMWLRLAERGGEAEAHALSEKVALRMQPADIQQAEASVQSWRPRPAPTAGTPP
jgi:TPR repeat protein